MGFRTRTMAAAIRRTPPPVYRMEAAAPGQATAAFVLMGEAVYERDYAVKMVQCRPSASRTMSMSEPILSAPAGQPVTHRGFGSSL